MIRRFILTILLAAGGCKSSNPVASQTDSDIQISTPSFRAGGHIPIEFAGDNGNKSPAIRWEHLPAGTKQLAILMDDIDAPEGGLSHWVVYHISASTSALPESTPHWPIINQPAAMQGINSWKQIGYRGPQTNQSPAHHFRFRLYAIDTELDLHPGLSREELMDAMMGHILGYGDLIAIYGG